MAGTFSQPQGSPSRPQVPQRLHTQFNQVKPVRHPRSRPVCHAQSHSRPSASLLPSSLNYDPLASSFADAAQRTYNRIAPTYDLSNQGWHIKLGQDFISWVDPPLKAGSAVLDLACGTGLVTYPAARAVGPKGLVVGVDVTPGMLDIAKGKAATDERNAGGTGGVAAPIVWIQADIGSDLLGSHRFSVIKETVQQRGGFDLITCCSAFILLANPRSFLKRWVKLLRPGGRIIIDVPTEDNTLPRLWYHELRLALGLDSMFDVGWIKGVHSLKSVFEEAGLQVEKSWRTQSYVPERWLEGAEDMEDIFDRGCQRGAFLGYRRGKRQVKEEWEKVWNRALDKDGRLWNGYSLYVVMGRKPLG